MNAVGSSLLSRYAGCVGRAGMGDGAGFSLNKCTYASMTRVCIALFIFSRGKYDVYAVVICSRSDSCRGYYDNVVGVVVVVVTVWG
jgi:hypothetical protein